MGDETQNNISILKVASVIAIIVALGFIAGRISIQSHYIAELLPKNITCYEYSSDAKNFSVSAIQFPSYAEAMGYKYTTERNIVCDEGLVSQKRKIIVENFCWNAFVRIPNHPLRNSNMTVSDFYARKDCNGVYLWTCNIYDPNKDKVFKVIEDNNCSQEFWDNYSSIKTGAK